ncbi:MULTISPECIES: DUF4331 domain-containing protein [Marinobacter]|uniref:DUF4331 domain-containing protein n=1 Tax=Marinobacter profundi TaxID=2666256 RepID=A0A2G1ULG8_9GAMM|nr:MULTISPECIES: DUF4331 domain-containing protein [Marinobacter]MBD3658393.1 DUF4331 domain-containing protein [Marinobacter sp.]PHQ15318.1 hypothetical protein CLH61_09345 [Marinobacter profundi]
MNIMLKRSALVLALAGLGMTATLSHGSSHREAPFITEIPKVDGSDFYLFRSYEAGREDFVTLIANYLPLQDAYGGPNYFDLDADAIYEIHVDNTGDAVEDLTFRFQLTDVTSDIELDVGGEKVAIPLKNAGAIGPGPADVGAVQQRQTYSVKLVQGDRRTGSVMAVTNNADGSETFTRPIDNIGTTSIPDYPAYAAAHVYDMAIPGCTGSGRVFVGQRKDAFAVNLGKIFDLVSIPLAEATNGIRDDGIDDLADKNVTAFALEVPTACLTGSARSASGDPVIGAWTTASIRQARVVNPSPGANGKGATVEGGAYAQVSRLGMPLVNEVVIGLRDKNAFNASEPKDDGQFATYVTNPTLPQLLQIVTGEAVAEPQVFPRVDLVATFLTGLTVTDDTGAVLFSNQPGGVQASDMLRLNTAIAPVDLASQNDLGLVAGDAAGFPNGRRPVDDVVDVALNATIGALLPLFGETNPNDGVSLDDGAVTDQTRLLDSFPYLGHPLAGSVTAM